MILGLQPSGLSHSEIPGSKVICTLPGLIAAYHVLHRLREPRHPPYALTYFFHLSPFPCSIDTTGTAAVNILMSFIALLFALSVQYVNDHFYMKAFFHFLRGE